MTEHQRLFLVQARADFDVFELFRIDAKLPVCHALHYLQMSTELLGKAWLWKHGPCANSHRAFVKFLRSLLTNRMARRRLGIEGRNESWKHRIRKSLPLAERIEELAPALSPDGPNAEYPWPRDNPSAAPAEHTFGIWQDLQTSSGRSFLRLLANLCATADAIL